MALNCARCGKSLAEQARFCSACGSPAGGPGTSRLYRPRAGRIVAGVCQGMSVVYGWDPVIVRLAAVLLGSLLIPIAILAYGVLWIVIPEERPALPSGLPLNSV